MSSILDDSTWAALNKRDSDLLLSCYGDKQNAIDALSLRQMTSDAGLTQTIDRILDMVTEGEHSRLIKTLEDSSGETTTNDDADKVRLTPITITFKRLIAGHSRKASQRDGD